jgi:cytochrome P450
MEEFSLAAPSVMEDPFPAFAQLRATCPVHRDDSLGATMYSVTRAPDVHEMLVNPQLWSNRKGPGVGYSAGSGRGDMQHDDPPEHRQRRGFVRDWFTPPKVDLLEPDLRSLAESLVARMLASGRGDLYRDLALPLPVTSFCAIMGVDLGDREQFLAWADELVVSMAFPERGAAARRAVSEFTRGEIERRRGLAASRAPLPSGLLTHLAVDAYVDGAPMPVDEEVNMANQLLIAGHETSTSLITNCVWRLLERREERWERVVADPSLVPNAVEESLRFDPPVLGLCRTNNVDTSVAGVAIPADSKVLAVYASANRDPARFPDRPDEFVVDRPVLETRRHYSFSWGIHHCLGAHLARLTGRVAVESLVRAVPGLRLDGPPTRVPSPFLWGRKTLPVVW